MVEVIWNANVSNTGFAFDFGKKAASAASGVLFALIHTASVATIYKSTNNGATLVSETTISGNAMMFVHVPYQGNDNDNIAYFGTFQSGGAGRLVRRNEDASFSTITVALSGTGPDGAVAIHSYTGNRNKMALISAYVASTCNIGRSTDAGSNWTDCKRPLNEVDLVGALGGWPYNENIMMCQVASGVNRGIYWTNEFFSAAAASIVWNKAMGNYESISGATFVGCHLVPVWTS